MNAALNLRERLDSQPKPPITTFRRVPDLGEDHIHAEHEGHRAARPSFSFVAAPGRREVC